MTSLRDFIQELKMNDVKGDAWAVAMGAFFDCAAHLYEKGDCPRQWGFKLGWAGNHLEEDAGFYESFLNADAELLLEVGNFLNRYTALLKRHGKSY